MSRRDDRSYSNGPSYYEGSPRNSRYGYIDPPESKMAPRILDIYGGHRDITVCGHIDVVHLLPLRQQVHRQLIETYRKIPGNYEGQFENSSEGKAKVLDYGNGYVAVHMYDDLTRPELGEFLLGKGWRMLGFSSTSDNGKTKMCEKWTNVHVRGDK